MRNFSLLSILLALVIGAVVWTKQLNNQPPSRVPDPVTLQFEDNEEEGDEYLADCDEQGYDEDCDAGASGSLQTEMEDQRRRAYGTVIESFDEEYGKYREQTGGRP